MCGIKQSAAARPRQGKSWAGSRSFIHRTMGTVLLGGLLFSGNVLAGVDIEVTNQSVSDIAFAFSYLDEGADKWVVEGWYNVAPRTKSIVTLKTDNSLVYIYGEVSNGTKIEGGRGFVELGVKWKSFRYEQDSGLAQPDSRAQFMRAIAIDSKVSLNIK